MAKHWTIDHNSVDGMSTSQDINAIVILTCQIYLVLCNTSVYMGLNKISS